MGSPVVSGSTRPLLCPPLPVCYPCYQHCWSICYPLPKWMLPPPPPIHGCCPRPHRHTHTHTQMSSPLTVHGGSEELDLCGQIPDFPFLCRYVSSSHSVLHCGWDFSLIARVNNKTSVHFSPLISFLTFARDNETNCWQLHVFLAVEEWRLVSFVLHHSIFGNDVVFVVIYSICKVSLFPGICYKNQQKTSEQFSSCATFYSSVETYSLSLVLFFLQRCSEEVFLSVYWVGHGVNDLMFQLWCSESAFVVGTNILTN